MSAADYSPDLDDSPGSRSNLEILKRYLGPLKWSVALLAVLLFSGTGLSLYLPQLIAKFVDIAKLGAEADLAGLTRLAVMYIVVALGVQIIMAGATYLGAHVGWLATNQLRVDLMQHLLSLDMSEHKERTPGEMIERIDGDVTALSNFFSQFAVRVFGAILMLIGATVMFYLIDWRVGLGVTAFIVITLVLMNRVRSSGVDPTKLEREASAKLFGFIEERLTGLDDIRALGAGRHHLRSFMKVQRFFFENSVHSWKKRSIVWQISMVLFVIGFVGVLSAAIGLYSAGVITLGTAFLLFQYMSMVEDPIDQLSNQFQDLQKAAASVGRISDLLSLHTHLPSGTKLLPEGPLNVHFKEVDFEYEAGGATVLNGVDFELPAGQTLGLLGRTGSGKTTLTRLLSRLYDPTSGSVRLGGIDTREMATSDLRKKVAVVTQDVQLFQASVRDNLSFFDSSLPDQRIVEALEEVGLGTWLASLKEGIDTPLPAGSLSAGQSQLLAFARVMLQDPALIILDEPSSRLDPATEHQLTKAMTKLLSGRTAIVIAHRLDTVARADRILVMGAGHILEHGTRQVLASQPESQYAQLLRAGKEANLEVLA